MSVLLLTNPYAPQQGQPPALQSDDGAAGANGLARSEGPDAIPPSRATLAGSGGGSATSFTGTGAGAGGFGSSAFARPNEATPRSVVHAKAAQADQGPDGASEPARRDPPQIRREDQNSTLSGGPNHPAAPTGMPDPLPTSPFLKKASF